MPRAFSATVWTRLGRAATIANRRAGGHGGRSVAPAPATICVSGEEEEHHERDVEREQLDSLEPGGLPFDGGVGRDQDRGEQRGDLVRVEDEQQRLRQRVREKREQRGDDE